MTEQHSHIDLLCYESNKPSSVPGSKGQPVLSLMVAAISLRGEAKGSKLIRGAAFDPRRPFDWYTIEWPTPKAERFAASFRRYLANSPLLGPAWNGHSVVAATEGWPVKWGSDRFYTNVSLGNAISTDEIQNGQPYAFTDAEGRVVQSVMGLENGMALCAAGLRRPIKILAATAVQTIWQGEYVRPYNGTEAPTIPGEALSAEKFQAIYDLPDPQFN